MFWKLEGKTSGKKIYFESDLKTALKKMHESKAKDKEEFILHGKHEKGRLFTTFTSTTLYPTRLEYVTKNGNTAWHVA